MEGLDCKDYFNISGVYLICAWVKPWKHLDFLFEESGAITSQNVSRLVVYIPIILQIVWIGCAVAALYLVFENSREFWILLSALAGGFITVAALGFTEVFMHQEAE